MVSAAEVGELLSRELPAGLWSRFGSADLESGLARYLELLLRWNRVVGLTSARTVDEVVRRHVAESLLCAAALPACDALLDLGSGAGFPGIPVQLARPELRVTLAEANGRKAAFLRETVRELGLDTEVFAGRAQTLAPASFGCVCLRAVDPMRQALAAAAALARETICVVGSAALSSAYETALPGWAVEPPTTLAAGRSAVLLFHRAG